MMKTFAWSFACSTVFVVAGIWATLGAALNVAAFTWSRAGGFEALLLFPNAGLRAAVGIGGILLLTVGLNCLVSTWRHYRHEQSRLHSPWRRKWR